MFTQKQQHVNQKVWLSGIISDSQANDLGSNPGCSALFSKTFFRFPMNEINVCMYTDYIQYCKCITNGDIYAKLDCMVVLFK